MYSPFESLILKLPYRVKMQNAVYVCAMIYVVLYSYLFAQRNQIAAVTPQMALKIITNMGVSVPRSRPMAPLLAFIGKTMKS